MEVDDQEDRTNDEDVDESMEIESEPDESQEGNDGEDEVQMRETRSRRASTTTATISFEEAMDPLKEFYNSYTDPNYTQKRGRGRGRGRRGRSGKKFNFIHSWKAIEAALEKEGTTYGIRNDDLNVLWNVVVQPEFPAPQGMKKRMVLAMLPCQPINEELVKRIVLWVVLHAKNPKIKSTFVIAVLDYLIGIVEYHLFEGDPFNNPQEYGLLFQLHNVPSLGPRVVHLLKKLTRAEFICESFVKDILLRVTQDMAPGTLRQYYDLLRLFNYLRPDMVKERLISIQRIPKAYERKFPQKLSQRFFESRSRVLELDRDDVYDPETRKSRRSTLVKKRPVGASLIVAFPEFPLSKMEYIPVSELSTLSKQELMLYSLKQSETIVNLAADPVAVQRFYSWVALIFRHKFEVYDKAYSHRYEFILQRCYELSLILDQSVPAVDDWLLEFLPTWDGVLFRNKVLALFPLMRPFDFNELENKPFLTKLSTLFLYGDEEGQDTGKVQIWNMLSRLCVRWSIMCSRTVSTEEQQNICSCLEGLFDFMNQMMEKYATFTDFKRTFVIIAFCSTFEELAVNYIKYPSKFQPLPSMLLLRMVILNDTVTTLDCFCKIMNIWTTSNVNLESSRIQKFIEVEGMLSRFFLGKAPFMDIFLEERRMMKKREITTNKENAPGTEIDNWQAFKTLSSFFSFVVSEGSLLFRRGEGMFIIDPVKVKEISPIIYQAMTRAAGKIETNRTFDTLNISQSESVRSFTSQE